jgi:hypothetical protein
MEKTKTLKIEVFIAEEYIGVLRQRLNQAGAGHIGSYDHCVSVAPVRGFWRPLTGAHPYDGEIGEIRSGEEMKLEVNCPEEIVSEVLKAILEVHPYDRPVINLIELANHKYEELAY